MSGQTGRVLVPVMVEAARRRVHEQKRTAIAAPVPWGAAGWAARAERMAELCDREARWWAVLKAWTHSLEAVRVCPAPLVFGEAVRLAEVVAREDAQGWWESARSWRARQAESGVSV